MSRVERRVRKEVERMREVWAEQGQPLGSSLHHIIQSRIY